MFSELIQQLEANEAIALGALRPDLPDQVEVTTKQKLEEHGGSAPQGLIARNGAYIFYPSGRPALALIDVDTKGMPDDVKSRIKNAGGYFDALCVVLPRLKSSARIVRCSTSTGIKRTDTGEELPGSSGEHIYLHVRDGADVERFLRTLHERCWLQGLGWHMVGAGGQLLDRSLVDRMVYAGERLVFEGPPVLVPPLAQDQALRQASVYHGAELDTREACPPLRIIETARLKQTKARSAHALASEQAGERERFIELRIEKLAEKAGLTGREARQVIERQCNGILSPDLVLPWDQDDFVGCTVGNVLADPARFDGATLADPLEGPDYGLAKAKVMRRVDGSPWINSFAHGRTVYELRYDFRAALRAVDLAPNDEVADVFVAVVTHADLDAAELETLRNRVADRTNAGRRAIDAKLNAARKERRAREKRETSSLRAAVRLDPRPQISAPHADAPWLPQMLLLNDVLGGSDLPEPPMRDIDGVMTQVRVRLMPSMHTLTAQGTNGSEVSEKLPSATEQPLLSRLDEIHLAELIEQHIDYIDDKGQSVHLPMPFVRHFNTRADSALPVVAAIATLPIVLPDSTLLAQRGLDREHGIVFRVPPDLLDTIPHAEECSAGAVAAAMHYLTDVWLCDVCPITQVSVSLLPSL